MPRAINFGDSAAIFVPSADLLLHIAARTKEKKPIEAKLARWLFDNASENVCDSPPHDRASFGFVNRPGFLSMPLLAHAINGSSPQELNLPNLESFSCGDVIARDDWQGKTTLAVRTGGESMHVVSHVHGDMNSLILVHNQERLLVDPGHSCYRNLIHDLECSTASHNTCIFHIKDQSRPLQQCGISNRRIKDNNPEPPLPSPTKLLLSSENDQIRIIISDAAGRYGNPIQKFIRICILCGSNAVFVIDRIQSSIPVTTQWNWLLNNRDNCGYLKIHRPDQLFFKRGDAGLKIFNCSNASVGGPQYAYVHDAYHPLPGQLGEGPIGSGLLVHWRQHEPLTHLNAIHIMAIDDGSRINDWGLHRNENNIILLRSGSKAGWSIRADEANATYDVQDLITEIIWRISITPSGEWRIESNSKHK